MGEPELRQGGRCQRQPDLQPRLRREDPQGLGHAAVRLADRRHAAAGDPAARVDRSRLLAPLAAELHRHRQPERQRQRTSISSASSRRPIRACPAAAATRSAASTTSSLTSSRCRSNNLRTYAPDYGKISQVYNGIDININARMRNGLQLQAGTSTGQRVTDYCDVRGKLPEQTGGFSTASEVPAYSPVNPFCHVEPGITTRFTSAGTYIVPKVDVHGVSARSRARRPSRSRRTGRCRARSSRRRSAGRCPAARRTSRSTCLRRMRCEARA